MDMPHDFKTTVTTAQKAGLPSAIQTDKETPDEYVLRTFYEALEPKMANASKVLQVLELFKGKANRLGRPTEWRELMYAKLAEKYVVPAYLRIAANNLQHQCRAHCV